MHTKQPFAVVGVIGLFALGISHATFAQVSGAIFTTTPYGEIVNENVHYAAKEDVFLNGGPGPNAPVQAAGLPPGEYYFQVTDPSGKKLLSSDSASERCVVVGSQGYITNDPCTVTPGAVTAHLLNPKVGFANEFVVQLFPYEDTPNNGGVYKAWMTPTSAYDGDPTALGDQNCGNGCFHGFIPAYSKTDNFKVRDVETYCITMWKFLESKKKGSIGPVEGWPIQTPNGILHTNEEGFLRICELTPGTYTVGELLSEDYELVSTVLNQDPISPPSATVTVTVGKGNRNDRDPIIVWTNRNVNDQECTKDCYYK